MYALNDLSSILHIKIFVFTIINNSSNHKLKIYDPAGSGNNLNNNDTICLLNSTDEPMKFKWLMPKNCKSFIEKNVTLTPNKLDHVHFLKVNYLYPIKIFIVSYMNLVQNFKQTIHRDHNFAVFIHFLTECPVHLLVYLKEFSIDTKFEIDTHKFINYLNQIWGNEHFNFNKVKIRMLYLVNKTFTPLL